jgi:MoaA/NifB/PqqE/SkfB family radical SAM enzyme
MKSNFNTYLEFGNNPFASQAKMLFHSDRVSQYILSGDTFPIFMELNLTDRCNLKCSWCISENRNDSSNELKIRELLKFLTEFKIINKNLSENRVNL